MGVVYKLKDEIRDFILEQKRVNPAVGCRTLAALAQDRFQVKLSKSSVNAIIKTAGMSMPVGRRVKDISKEKPAKFISGELSEELGRAAEPVKEEKARQLESRKWANLAEEERRSKMPLDKRLEEDKRALEEGVRKKEAVLRAAEEARRAETEARKRLEEDRRLLAQAKKAQEEKRRQEESLKRLEEARRKDMEKRELEEARKKIEEQARAAQAAAEHVVLEAARKAAEEISGKIREDKCALEEAKRSVDALAKEVEEERKALELEHQARQEVIRDAAEARKILEEAHRRELSLKALGEELKRKQETLAKAEEEMRLQEEREKAHLDEARQSLTEGQAKAEVERVRIEAERKRVEEERLDLQEARKSVEELTRNIESEKSALEEARKALEQEILQAQEAKRAAEAAKQEAEEAARKEVEEARRQAEEESKRKAQELAQQQAEEQARQEKEEQARQEKEQARKSQEEAAAKQAEEKPAQPAQGADSRRMQEEEAARLAEADKWRHLAEEERLKKEAAQKSEADNLAALKSQIKSASQPVSSAPAAADQKCSGIMILKAAEALVGASRAIAETIRSRAGRQKSELAALIEEAVLAGISPDTSGETGALLAGFQADKAISSDISSVLKSSLQEVRCIKLQLSDGNSLFIDGQMYTVWSTQNIPYDFCGCFNNVKGYINKYFYQNLPFTLFTAPGYDTPSKEFFSLLMSLEGNGSAVSKLILYGNKFEELEIMSFDQPKKRFYLFGFFPWQFSEQRKVNKIGEFKPMPFAALGRQIYVADVDLTLLQPAIGQSVQLRGCAVKLSPQDKARQIIVSNIPPDVMNTEELANAYLGHWPNMEEAFQDYSRKVELFTYTVDSQRYFSVDSLGLGGSPEQDPGKLLAGYLEALDSYVRWHFLPTGFEARDMAFTKEAFYSLEAVLSRQQDNTVVTFQPPSDYAYLKELQYLARRVNEREVALADGSRLWLIA